ncbi:MAG TPA: 3-oxoacyl-ACP synthase, partial [Advenella sp.]|nr:3-oxoacyl-ACP synthase [Advenella sp.]
MTYSTIVGTGSYLPPKCVTNTMLAQDMAQRGLETSDEWIVTRTGIHQRHLADPGVTSSELGFLAAEKALADAGIAAADLDLIIVATSTPDFIFPSTA